MSHSVSPPCLQDERGTIGLVVYMYPFDKSPSLQNLARDLQRTHRVTVLLDPRHAGTLAPDIAACVAVPSTPAAAPPGHTYPRGRFETFARERLPGWLRRWARDLFIARELLAPMPAFRRFLRSHPRPQRLIAADKPSLLACLLAGRVPDLYYSLEATPLREEDSRTYQLLNLVESLYVRWARPGVVAQSPARAGLVQPRVDRQILIPVTSDGAAFPRSSFLREHLGLAPEHRILLIAGGLGPDQMTFEILRQAAGWDPALVLVLHSASGRYTPELLAAARDPALAGRVRLTELQLNIEDAERLVYASADIGLVFYRDIGFNHRHTAYSSGKLAAFLRAGVPVVVPDFDEFRAALARFRFGEAVPLEGIGAAAAAMLSDPGPYIHQARLAFEQVYSFGRYAGRVAAYLADGKT